MGFLSKLFHPKKNEAITFESLGPRPRRNIIPFSQFKPKTKEEIEKLNNDHAANLSKIDLSNIDLSPAYTGNFSYWDIEFLAQIERIKFNKPSIGRYWTTAHHIDFNSLLHHLWGAGYIVSVPLEVDLSAFKVDELKSILLQNNLDVSGKKSDLIKRIVGSVPLSFLKMNRLIPNKFRITDSGITAIQNSRRDKVSELSMLAENHRKNNDYDYWRDATKDIMDIHLTNNAWREALFSGIQIYRFDLFYFQTMWDYQMYLCSIGHGLPVKSQAMIAPGIIVNIKKCVQELSLTKNDLFQIFDSAYQDDAFPDCICSKEEAYDLFIRYLNEPFDSLDYVVESYNRRFDARYRRN